MHLTEYQREAIFSDNPRICVTASAGTGKTLVLINRYIHLLEKEKLPPDRIVALTFSRNAAKEMRDRIREGVEEKIKSCSGKEAAYWKKVFRKLDTARITTFHSFYADILKSYPFDIGIDPDFVIAGDDELLMREIDEIYRKTASSLNEKNFQPLKNLLRYIEINQLKNNYILPLYLEREKLHYLSGFKGLSPDNLPELPEGLIKDYLEELPKIVVSGFDWRRIDVEARALLRELRTVTFTDEKAVVCLNNYKMKIKSILSLSRRIRNDEVKLQIEGFIESVRESAGKERKSEDIIGELSLRIRDIQQKYKKIAEKNNKIIKNSTAEQEDLMREFSTDLLSVYTEFENAVTEWKRKSSRLDYNDLAIYARRLIYDNTNVRESLREGISHLLVDEFQDTDRVQLDIIKAIAGFENGLIPEDTSGCPSLFVVGDDKQSIYRFRGADVTVFSEIKRLIEISGGQIINLDKNFRSSGDIIRFHNRFFPRFIPRRTHSEYDSIYRYSHSHHKIKNELAVELLFVEKEDDKREDNDSDLDSCVNSSINYRYPAEEETKIAGLRRSEAGLIAAKIKSMVESEEVQINENGGARAVRYGDIALLFNALSSFEIYERELITAGIPYLTAASEDFYYRPEVMDILNLLQAVSNPFDNFYLASALRSPIFGISDETLFTLLFRREQLLWDQIKSAGRINEISEKQNERLNEAAVTIRFLSSRKDFLTVRDFVELVLDKTSYREIYAGVSGSLERLYNIHHFIEQELPGLIAGGDKTVDGLLHDLKRIRESGYRVNKKYPFMNNSNGDDEEGGSVLVSTIHQAKGMEFPVVFVPNLSQKYTSHKKIFIDYKYGIGLDFNIYDDVSSKSESVNAMSYRILKDLNNRQEEAEKKRLMYVAVTRAKDRIILSGADKKKGKGPFIEMIADFLSGGRFRKNRPANIRDIVKIESIKSGDLQKSDVHPDKEEKILINPLEIDCDVSAPLIDPVELSYTTKNRFAPTELNDYAACPRLYYYKNVMMIPDDIYREQPRSTLPMSGKDFGSFIHYILARHRGENPPEWEYKALNLIPTDEKIVKQHTEKLLLNYKSTDIYKKANSTSEVYREFPFISSFGEYLIEGIMDMLFIDEDGLYHIVDFKSDGIGKSEVGEKASFYRPQLSAYAASAAKLFSVNNLRYSIIFLTPGITHTEEIDKAGLTELNNQISEIIRSIRDDKNWQGTEHCDDCPYKQLCHKTESKFYG